MSALTGNTEIGSTQQITDQKNSMATGNPRHVQESPHPHDNIAPDHSSEQDNHDDDRETRCGIGSFHPTVLGMCANMPAFTGVFSVCALVSSSLVTYVNSQVTTLERHFGFSSSQTGLIMAANDMGFLIIVLFVSYLASRVHIPRALGYFTILFGVSGIACALPYFLFGAPSPSSSNGDGISNISSMTSARPSGGLIGQMCDGFNHTSMICDVKEGQTTQSVEPGDAAKAHAGTALVIIVMGMVLQGVAKTPRVSFSTVYVDANVEKVQTGFYMGITIAVGLMGPATAFALGGVFTRVYVTLEDTDMNYRHPKWIGAWWLGYIAFGCAACLVAIPLLCFPRRMRGGHQKKEPVTRPQPDSVSVLKRTTEHLKDFLGSMIRLLTNPVYVCTLLATCTLLFAVAGGLSFTPKYIENQFAFPAWKANMAIAGVILSSAVLGTFVGGYLTRRLKMGPMVSLKFLIVFLIGAFISFALPLFFTCDQPYIYNSPGPRASEDTSIQGCLENCACDDGDYFPVCADDGRTFFSPCHAGCDSTANGIYVNCTCIQGGTAVAGMCDYGCAMFYPFVASLCLGKLFGTLAIVPKILVYIRAVEERDKAMAMGLHSFLTSITGWMLGPIIFGKLIDDICIQWEHGCGATGGGACRLYDNDSFRWKLIGYQTLFRGVALVFIILAYIAARVTKKFEGKEKKDNSPEGNTAKMKSLTQEHEDSGPDNENGVI